MLRSEISDRVLRILIEANSLDASNSAGLKALVLEEEDGLKQILVDVSRVRFVDSSGVGALLSLHKLLGAGHEGVVLQGVTPPVLTVLELLRLHQVFTIEAA